MNKTRIEWCDYSWNPIVGCKRDCWYCYGKKIRKRFFPEIPWTELMWFDERLDDPLKVKEPSKIFVGSMSDICYWREIDIKGIIEIAKKCPQHTFQFLTKDARIYHNFDFPMNCWLGETITDWDNKYGISPYAGNQHNIRFVSLEPLLSDIKLSNKITFDWIIIGVLTGAESKKYSPKKEWIENIIKQAKYYNIPIFIKNNVKWKDKIQQFPYE